jgi:hypothetical protein
MRVASQATEGATKLKSHTMPALRAMPAAQVQISLPMRGVLRDVRHAFLGLCIDAGQKVPAAMMDADRIALCGPKVRRHGPGAGPGGMAPAVPAHLTRLSETGQKLWEAPARQCGPAPARNAAVPRWEWADLMTAKAAQAAARKSS